MALKRVRILSAAIGVVLLLSVVGTLAGWRFLIHTHEGYFSPVFSPDRGSVLYLERKTRGIVWGLGIEHFTPPAHAFVLSDEFSLKRLHRETGAIDVLAHWPSSPLVGKHLRTYRNRIFSALSARLQFSDDGILEYGFSVSIPKQPRSESWSIRGVASAENFKDEAQPWQSGKRPLYGHARYVLDGDWELIHFYGEAAYPPAIVMFNGESRQSRVLLRSPGFLDQFADGIPVRTLADRSVRAAVERIDALAQVRDKLLTKYKQEGLSDGVARLRTTAALRELGYLSRPPTLVARVVDEVPQGASVFTISGHEFQVGLFQDIERAIRHPGTPVEHSTGTYLRYEGYDSSARLKAFLDGGGMRFYVITQGRSYAIEKKPSQPATR